MTTAVSLVNDQKKKNEEKEKNDLLQKHAHIVYLKNLNKHAVSLFHITSFGRSGSFDFFPYRASNPKAPLLPLLHLFGFWAECENGLLGNI